MKLTKDEFVLTDGESPLELFKQGIRAEATRDKYTRTLKWLVMEFLDEFLEGDFENRIKQLVKITKENPEWTKKLLLSISKKLRSRTELPTENKDYLNPSSFDNYFKPIKKLFDMNDISFAWKRIYSTFPEINNSLDGRGWTRNEISKMVKHQTGSMDCAIVLVLASSGIRAGGLKLDWEDITPVYELNGKLVIEITELEEEKAKLVCGMLKIYKGSSEQYPAFVTPEAFFSLEEWKKEWARRIGRQPKEEDPIFINEGDLPRRATTASLKKRVERMIQKAELRPPLTKGKRRHDAPTMNGFRRFWNKTVKESLSRDSPLASFIKKEFIMGHMGMFKLDKNYFKTQVLELAEEYLQAVSDLTISNEFRLRIENVKLIQEKTLVTDELINTQERFEAKLDELFKNQEKQDEIISDLAELSPEDSHENKIAEN